jgi:hypothetical protein
MRREAWVAIAVVGVLLAAIDRQGRPAPPTCR